MKLSLRFLFALTAAVAVYLFFLQNPYLLQESPGRIYQRTRDLAALRSALMEQVHSGDSYEQVRSILGPGYRKSAQETSDFIEMRVAQGRDLECFGEQFGNDPGDFIIEYASNYRVKFTLVFLGGVLANYDAKRYEPPPDNKSGVITAFSN